MRGDENNSKTEIKIMKRNNDNNKPSLFPYAAKRNTSWLRSLKFAIAGTGFTSLETLKATEIKKKCFRYKK